MLYSDGVPRPRVLFENVPEHLIEPLEALAPTSQRIASTSQVHASDWDLLVTYAPSIRTNGPYHVLSVGAEDLSGQFKREDGSRYALRRSHTTYARGAYVSSQVPSMMRPLAQRLSEQNQQAPSTGRTMWAPYLFHRGIGFSRLPEAQLLDLVEPIVQVGAEGLIHAFSCRRYDGSDGASILWSLPPQVEDIRSWLEVFMAFLRQFDDTSFPESVAWLDSKKWASLELERAHGRLQKKISERTDAVILLNKQVDQAEKQVEKERKAATRGAQRLLTADSDDLVDAVRAALDGLGFDTQLMDDHHQEKAGAKLEDLRVCDPAVPGWTALVEVKGYLKGAKVSDLAQIVGRPAVAFAIANGRAPDRLWHVVNAFRRTDPGSRPKAISNDALDLQALSASDGVLIDTRDLFLAAKWATNADLKLAVRQHIRDSLGRWTWPGSVGEEQKA